MKKLLLIPVGLITGLTIVGFTNNSNGNLRISTYKKEIHRLNSDGPAAGKTGAPGENNCTQCHSGTAQNGNGINLVVMTDGANMVTSYTPGTTYTVTVTLTNANAKNGFQIVALNASNAQAGAMTIIPSSGTQLKTGAAGKKYVTHTSAGNAQSTWSFQWTAPATNVGDVTFFLATNKTNSLNNSSGDVIYVSQHVFGSVANTEEAPETMSFEAGYQAANNTLVMNYSALTDGESAVNVVDLNGKSVYFSEVGKSTAGTNKKLVRLPESIENGIYIVHFNVNNTFVSKKILISK